MGRGRVPVFHKNAKFIANIRTVGVNITDSGLTGKHRILIDSLSPRRLGACGFGGYHPKPKRNPYPVDERFLIEMLHSIAL